MYRFSSKENLLENDENIFKTSQNVDERTNTEIEYCIELH